MGFRVLGSGTKEYGSGNAECENYENQTFSQFLFRIPHSEFHIQFHPTPETYLKVVKRLNVERPTSNIEY